MMVLTTNTNDVEHFISLFDLPAMAKDVLRTIEDCHTYLDQFHEKNHHLYEDLLDFRDYLIATSLMTLNAFMDMCYLGQMKEAFEKTFFESYNEEEMALMQMAILKEEITLEGLYDKFQRDPNQRILSYFM